MKKLMVLLVSLIAITATAQVRAIFVAASNHFLTPETIVYSGINTIKHYTDYEQTMALQGQSLTPQTEVAPIILPSDNSTVIAENTIHQEDLPVVTSISENSIHQEFLPVVTNKSIERYNSMSESTLYFNWLILGLIVGIFVFLFWFIPFIYQKARGNKRNHNEGYTQTIIPYDDSCCVLLANCGGVLIRKYGNKYNLKKNF